MLACGHRQDFPLFYCFAVEYLVKYGNLDCTVIQVIDRTTYAGKLNREYTIYLIWYNCFYRHIVLRGC